jgi:hypothetical protein
MMFLCNYYSSYALTSLKWTINSWCLVAIRNHYALKWSLIIIIELTTTIFPHFTFSEPFVLNCVDLTSFNRFDQV